MCDIYNLVWTANKSAFKASDREGEGGVAKQQLYSSQSWQRMYTQHNTTRTTWNMTEEDRSVASWKQAPLECLTANLMNHGWSAPCWHL